MNKLSCYGITARALQILTNAEHPVGKVPDAWFNWVGVTPYARDLKNAYAPRRLEVVSADSAGRWCKNSVAAGYDCVYVGSIDDDFCIDDLDDLEDGIGYSIVVPSGDSCDSNRELLRELREPDKAVVLLWGSIRGGGGAPIDKMGFAEVTAQQWVAFGNEMSDWIQENAEGKESTVRIKTPDFSKWNPWEHLGGPSRMLSLSEHFDTLPTDHWPWSVENPITKKDVPNLASDIEAFWPMRQMPFCGVARTISYID